jgi:ABC-2 type transport system permease protein
VRQPTRVVASVGTPVLMWVVLAAGLSGSVRAGEEGYGAYLVPGMALMAVVFSAIFGAISLIQDRQEGFLRAVLVSGAPRWSVVAAKVAAGAGLAAAQGVLVVLAGAATGSEVSAAGVALAGVALVLAAAGVVGVSLAAAWWIDSTSGFHGVMNLVLMPMWLFSGAVMPVDGMAGWMRWVARANPLSACNELVRGAGQWDQWAHVGGFAAAGVTAAWWVMARRG